MSILHKLLFHNLSLKDCLKNMEEFLTHALLYLIVIIAISLTFKRIKI